MVATILVATPAPLPCNWGIADPPPPIEDQIRQALKYSQAVFLGRVVAIEPHQLRRLVLSDDIPPPSFGFDVRFEVEAIWKGTPELRTVVETGNGGGDCGYTFTLGERYLVYAYNAYPGPSFVDGDDLRSAVLPPRPTVRTGIDTRTSLAAAATADLETLGVPSWRAPSSPTPPAPAGTIGAGAGP